MALPLEGKVAVVTGSSRGIGKVTAVTLAQDGADVVVCARSETTGRYPGTIGETAAAVEALGRRSLALRVDVMEEADLRALVEKTLATFGRIDILVNNAGLTGTDARGDLASFFNAGPEVMDAFYRANVRAPYVLTQLAAAAMAEAGGGAIVNISSGSARNPSPPSEERRGGGSDPIGVVYGASKAALDRLGTGIAAELMAKNIAVVTLYPGFTVTERAIALGRDISRGESPEVTAKAVAFVCRDPMAHTGQIYRSRDVVEEHGL